MRWRRREEAGGAGRRKPQWSREADGRGRRAVCRGEFCRVWSLAVAAQYTE